MSKEKWCCLFSLGVCVGWGEIVEELYNGKYFYIRYYHRKSGHLELWNKIFVKRFKTKKEAKEFFKKSP